MQGVPLWMIFIFQLNYAEAVELLWSAGHPFDNGSLRDYIIAECLVNKTYDYEAESPSVISDPLSGFRAWRKREYFDLSCQYANG